MSKHNLNTYWAELIIEELIRCGIDYFVISPGSRSTPLVAAAARNPKARTIVSIDERGSGFHALGYARGSGRPAAVITTSGTAAANLYPAVIEASNDNIPMVVLTADRPNELIDTGANQTIDQVKMFGEYTRFSFDMPCPDKEISPQMVLTTLDQAVYRASGCNAGPVQINCRYRKPLEPAEVKLPRGYTEDLEMWLKSNKPFTKYSAPSVCPSQEDFDTLVDLIDKARRGMIIVGRLDSHAERIAVRDLINKLSWPAYTDISSGLRLTSRGSGIIRYFDQDLLSEKFNKSAKPETVFHIGRRTTSKRIPLFFKQNRPKNYIVIKDSPQRLDPVHTVTMHVQGSIAETCDKLIAAISLQKENKYSKFYLQKSRVADAIIADNIKSDLSLTELFVARQISATIPNGSAMFLSNSMPVRDMDLYAEASREDILVGVNRGVSGIDGILSSATGYAAATHRLTTLLIGDLAFIHEINALAALKSTSVPVIAVVINNSGGGIFHFLPIAKNQDLFEEFFAASHNFTFEGAASTFGIDYYKAQRKESFTEAYTQALEKGVSAVIEVTTDRNENLKLRKTIKKQILKMLQE